MVVIGLGQCNLKLFTGARVKGRKLKVMGAKLETTGKYNSAMTYIV